MRYPYVNDLITLCREKLVTQRHHPTLPLSIFNYSPAATSLKPSEWTPALCDARGMILENGTQEIIGRPFPKFWNYEQVAAQAPTTQDWVAYEKLDGSLGIFCNYKGQLVVATRGSFESDQAKWAADYIRKHNPHFCPANDLTYLAEIIYPENRIVVDYQGAERLVLLSIMGHDGTEFPEIARNYPPKGFDLPKIVQLQGLELGSEYVSPKNEEGYVVRWPNGFRAKIKFDEYKRLHRLITQCSTRTIWELLREGKSLDELLDRVPPEFQSWVNKVATDLVMQEQDIFIHSAMRFRSRRHYFPYESRKDFALWAKGEAHPHLLFAMLDNKPVDRLIWDMIEPEWATPFRAKGASDGQ